jgi:hypothetical protein
MQSIHIISENGKVRVIIDGAELKRLHSFSVDYIEGAPLLFSCVADVGTGTREEKPRLVN